MNVVYIYRYIKHIIYTHAYMNCRSILLYLAFDIFSISIINL